MAETTNVPGVGQVSKGWVIAGLASLGVILGVAYYRHSKSSTAAAQAVQATQQDPNAIDPATGLTYGEEAAGVQSGTLAGAGTPYGDTSGLIGYDSQGQPIYADQVGYGPSPSFTTNGNWAQAAQSYLVASTGADAGTVANALGAYINGQVLTDAQVQIVHSAIAFFGQPPQAGSNGYPPSLRLSGTSGTTGGSTGTGGSGDSGNGGLGGTNPGGPDIPAGNAAGMTAAQVAAAKAVQAINHRAAGSCVWLPQGEAIDVNPAAPLQGKGSGIQYTGRAGWYSRPASFLTFSSGQAPAWVTANYNAASAASTQANEAGLTDVMYMQYTGASWSGGG